MISRLAVALGLAFLLSGCAEPPDKNEELTEIFQPKAVIFEESGATSFKVIILSGKYDLCSLKVGSNLCSGSASLRFGKDPLPELEYSRVLYVDGRVEILTPPEVKNVPLYMVVAEFELMIDKWIDYSICDVNHSGKWRPEDVELAKNGVLPNRARCTGGYQNKWGKKEQP
ncbi:hypothetical protein [Vibrio alginolyticus]|uniref:hypothetical protein n=1 Tax=Vibrio alginolyticus TaxID=663 RepID=UPI0006CAA1FD|nr:hypothetical protein [Vibrio alginolyticus]KPM97625.1 hypothetical protein AOG25_14275 [Vibrio alginolyticus]